MITIGIVLYNEEKHMSLLESNLQLLTSFFPQITVVIVNNASTDSTATKLDNYKTRFPFLLLHRTENNLGSARQDVMSAAQTEWVGFIDGDCGVSYKWVQAILERVLVVPKTVSAFGGPWLPAGGWREDYGSVFRSPMGHFALPQLSLSESVRDVSHIPTANVIYRRCDVICVGGFLPSFVFVGEDLDLSYRLRADGKQLWMYADLPIQHYLPCSYSQWAKKIFNYGRARVQVAAKHSRVFDYILFLPILFISILIVSAFYAEWRIGVCYLLASAVLSLLYSQGKNSFRVWLLVLITHFSYALGMVYQWWRQVWIFCSIQTQIDRHSKTKPIVEKIANFAAEIVEKT